jgi:hypothetical protein
MDNHYVLYCKKLIENSIITRNYRIKNIILNKYSTKYKIDNLIPEYSDDIYKNVKSVAIALSDVEGFCEIKILSWFIKDTLIDISKQLKEHCFGYAVDFITDDVDRDFDILKERLPKFTRLIKETDETKRIHLEYNRDNDKIWFVL